MYKWEIFRGALVTRTYDTHKILPGYVFTYFYHQHLGK